jgi:hypothetical protein
MVKRSFWDRPLGQVLMAVGLVAWVAALLAFLWVLLVLIHILFNIPLDVR